MFIKNIIATGFLTVLGLQVHAQQKDSISTINNPLGEIVISGQFSPQSVNKSIYNVTVISREMIDRQGGNNLADVLNQTLNINIIPNASTGKSGVKLFGLDSQYFKILVDNIPLINEEGFGTGSDLTQINLDDIAQIEIVEGAMGVDYGANAVTGIINIITKKSSQYKWEITPSIQEESIGNEYNLKDKGRHIQSIKVGRKFSDNLFASVSYTHNDFKGFWDDRQGEYHALNDNKRGYSWLPKNQHNVKGLLNYYNDHYRVYYKFEFFDETMKDFNSIVHPNPNSATGTADPYSDDAIHNPRRFFHLLNASGRVRDAFNFDVSLSYQKQETTVDAYRYKILYDEKYSEREFVTESRNGYYSKGLFSNFINNDKIDFQAGYEVSQHEGFSSSLGSLSTEKKDVSKTLGSYDFFASSEINLTNRFSLRPGYRAMTSNLLPTQHAASLTAKYLFNQGYELRGHLGMSPRLPNFEELYTYMVDVNHNIQGNADLNPEKAWNTSLNLKKNFIIEESFEMENNLSIRALVVNDLIDLIQMDESPKDYKYENLEKYQNYSFTYNNNMRVGNLTAGLGFTYAGMIKEMHKAPKGATDKMLFSGQLNANLSYLLPQTNTSFSVFFKYNGPEYKFTTASSSIPVDPSKPLVYVKGKQSPYSLLDFTVRQPFLDKKFTATIGVRNLLNVKETKTTISSGEAHSAAAPTQLLAYGTSVFVKIQYFLNFK
ncbi:TonB-dependent siderophore receptor [Flavobacterium sp. HSC-61S13]|uniref:TonB-dependent receptor plug domain-containing protein n=1 Tax=Flavobacterium sp. HSC-61S13 TaxID=2910963 RepID=UPI00209E7478|nr:TonB-dependent receptor plug domain-containing protein [Flavobacterium sp. HSC-61S13]MCP1994772.1 outer membrane receptor for ferrienterochelin and colicins [Flavobacterium sp. HSC-61S13]